MRAMLLTSAEWPEIPLWGGLSISIYFIMFGAAKPVPQLSHRQWGSFVYMHG